MSKEERMIVLFTILVREKRRPLPQTTGKGEEPLFIITISLG